MLSSHPCDKKQFNFEYMYREYSADSSTLSGRCQAAFLVGLFSSFCLMVLSSPSTNAAAGVRAVHVAALVRPSDCNRRGSRRERPATRDGLEPGSAALDAEVLVEQVAVKALDDAVVPGSLHPGGSVRYLL